MLQSYLHKVKSSVKTFLDSSNIFYVSGNNNNNIDRDENEFEYFDRKLVNIAISKRNLKERIQRQFELDSFSDYSKTCKEIEETYVHIDYLDIDGREKCSYDDSQGVNKISITNDTLTKGSNNLEEKDENLPSSSFLSTEGTINNILNGLIDEIVILLKTKRPTQFTKIQTQDAYYLNKNSVCHLSKYRSTNHIQKIYKNRQYTEHDQLYKDKRSSLDDNNIEKQFKETPLSANLSKSNEIIASICRSNNNILKNNDINNEKYSDYLFDEHDCDVGDITSKIELRGSKERVFFDTVSKPEIFEDGLIPELTCESSSKELSQPKMSPIKKLFSFSKKTRKFKDLKLIITPPTNQRRHTYSAKEKVRLVRNFENDSMVRVGGGWETLDDFLDKNYLCNDDVHLEVQDTPKSPVTANQRMQMFKPKAVSPRSIDPTKDHFPAFKSPKLRSRYNSSLTDSVDFEINEKVTSPDIAKHTRLRSMSPKSNVHNEYNIPTIKSPKTKQKFTSPITNGVYFEDDQMLASPDTSKDRKIYKPRPMQPNNFDQNVDQMPPIKSPKNRSKFEHPVLDDAQLQILKTQTSPDISKQRRKSVKPRAMSPKTVNQNAGHTSFLKSPKIRSKFISPIKNDVHIETRDISASSEIMKENMKNVKPKTMSSENNDSNLEKLPIVKSPKNKPKNSSTSGIRSHRANSLPSKRKRSSVLNRQSSFPKDY